MSSTFIFLTLTVAILLLYSYSDNFTICIEDSFVTESRYCAGEVQMYGNNINLGIHRVGSFGTTQFSQMSYDQDYLLGFIADYDGNGWVSDNSSLPGYSGEFVTTGAPVEGIK
jgi:hypothetical protein